MEGSPQAICVHVALPDDAAHDVIAGVNTFPIPAHELLLQLHLSVIQSDEFRTLVRAFGAQCVQIQYPLGTLAYDVQNLALGILQHSAPCPGVIMAGEYAVDISAVNVKLDGRCTGRVGIPVVHIAVSGVGEGKLIASRGEGEAGLLAVCAEILYDELNIGAGLAFHADGDGLTCFECNAGGVFETGIIAYLVFLAELLQGKIGLEFAVAIVLIELLGVAVELGEISKLGNRVLVNACLLCFLVTLCQGSGGLLLRFAFRLYAGICSGFL